MALGFLSLILYQTWQQDYNPRTPTVATTETSADGVTPAVPAPADLPQAAGTVEQTATPAAVSATAGAASVSVITDVLDISVSTIGGTIESVELLDYSVSIDDETPFTLASTKPSRFLSIESGLQSRANEPAPTHLAPLESLGPSEVVLGEGESVVVPFRWVSDKGIEVSKTLTFKKGSYEVDVEYSITNNSSEAWPVNQYRQLKRKPGTKDEKQQFVNTYIGAVVSNAEDKYNKVSFGNIEDENFNEPVTDGWVAMIQHYFAAAWIPTKGEGNTAYTRFIGAPQYRYIVGMVSDTQSVPAGGSAKFSTTAYVGPSATFILATQNYSRVCG